MATPRILIVRTDRLGDVVLTLPVARAIKIAMPESEVTFLCREYTQPIVERSPDVDRVLVRPERSSLSQDIRLFKSGSWDAAFFPNARLDLALAAFLARIPHRVGTGYRWYSPLFSERIMEHRKTAAFNEAVFNLRMLRKIGIDASPDILPSIVLRFAEVERVEVWRRQTLTSANSPYAVLHITSGGSSHSWPIEYWSELGQRLSATHEIVLTGTSSDAAQIDPLVSELRAHGIHAHSFIGHPLPELAALLAGAAAVVSGSTGPGHLAAALGAPTVGLFPLPPALSKERWGFRGARAINLSPNALDSCPSCTTCTCMARIAPETVASTLRAPA